MEKWFLTKVSSGSVDQTKKHLRCVVDLTAIEAIEDTGCDQTKIYLSSGQMIWACDPIHYFENALNAL